MEPQFCHHLQYSEEGKFSCEVQRQESMLRKMNKYVEEKFRYNESKFKNIMGKVQMCWEKV